MKFMAKHATAPIETTVASIEIASQSYLPFIKQRLGGRRSFIIAGKSVSTKESVTVSSLIAQNEMDEPTSVTPKKRRQDIAMAGKSVGKKKRSWEHVQFIKPKD